jgi:hypothetical protein
MEKFVSELFKNFQEKSKKTFYVSRDNMLAMFYEIDLEILISKKSA